MDRKLDELLYECVKEVKDLSNGWINDIDKSDFLKMLAFYKVMKREENKRLMESLNKTLKQIGK